MTSPARQAALRVLRSIHTGRAGLAHAQARVRATISDPRDRALATEIVTGTLRWRAMLDHVIQQVSSRSLTRIDPDVLDLLRLSTYQLLRLEKVPDHAVVNDAVSLARSTGKRSAAPFVNAVLRAIISGSPQDGLPQKPASSDPQSTSSRSACLDYLSVTLSHPRWLVDRWYTRYGFEATERWALFNNAPAPITLRVNTRAVAPAELAVRLADSGIETTPGAWTPNALVVTSGNPLTTPLGAQGLFWFQDEASQLVAELVAARANDRVLDACASPGGKSLVMAGMMGDRGLIVCGDLRPTRISLLAETLSRIPTHCSSVVQLDARHVPFGAVFDRVLLDVPCSGLGTLRRDPDIRWRRTAKDFQDLTTVQRELLTGAAAAVPPGGRVVYATCSSEPEENHLVVRWFLETDRRFEVEPPVIRRLHSLVSTEGFFQTLPFRDGLESFFAAVLRRRSP